MDYIIFGLGVGATLTLIGWSFRMWGPALRDRTSDNGETVLSGYELVNRMAWQRFCRSCGAVLAMFGLLVLAVTIVSTVLTLSNSIGATIVVVTLGTCLVATLVWLGLFLHRFGARGIIRPRIARPDSEPAAASVEPASVSAESVPSERRGGAQVAVASETSPDATDTSIDTVGAGAEASDAESAIPDETYDATRDEVEVTASEPDPEHGDSIALEEASGDDEEDAGYDADQPSPESSEPVERPAEEEAETSEVIFRSAAGNEHPSVGSPAVSDVGIDASRDDGTGADANVSDDQGSLADDSDTRDDLAIGEPPVRETDKERDTTVVQAHPDVPDSSGRAEAVRGLRQRRIRRMMQEPPNPE